MASYPIHRVWGKLDGVPVEIGETYSSLIFLSTVVQPKPSDVITYNCTTDSVGNRTCTKLGVAEPLNLANCQPLTFGGNSISCAIPADFNKEERKMLLKQRIEREKNSSVLMVFLLLLLLLFLLLLVLIWLARRDSD
jgi:hypothetical protein